MSINLYKNWDPSKGDYVDSNFEEERIRREKDKFRNKVQLIVFSIIFFGLLAFSFWYATRLKR